MPLPGVAAIRRTSRPASTRAGQEENAPAFIKHLEESAGVQVGSRARHRQNNWI